MRYRTTRTYQITGSKEVLANSFKPVLALLTSKILLFSRRQFLTVYPSNKLTVKNIADPNSTRREPNNADRLG